MSEACRCCPAATHGRSGDGDRGRGSAAVLRASGCRIQLVASLGRRTRGQRVPRSYGGEQLLGSGLTGGEGVGSKISARRGENLGVVVPRRVAGPWRSFGAANGGLGCGGAARGHGGAVLCSHGARGEAATVWSGGAAGWERRRGSGWFQGEGPGISVCRPAGKSRRSRRTSVARRGKRDEGDDRWGLPVSGTTRAGERLRRGWAAERAGPRGEIGPNR